MRRGDLDSLRRCRRAKSRRSNLSEGCRGFAEVVAEVGGGVAPESFEGGFAVGEEVSAVGKKGRVPPGWKRMPMSSARVDGVDVLVTGVEAEEDGRRVSAGAGR